MSTKQSSTMADRTVVIHRVISASAFRRLRNDFTRQKKAKKALRRMRKEGNNERVIKAKPDEVVTRRISIHRRPMKSQLNSTSVLIICKGFSGTLQESLQQEIF